LKGALLLFFGFSTQILGAGLNSYTDLIVEDAGAMPRSGVRVTYLGTNGYQFEFQGHALIIDPYFSRVDLLNIALGSRLQPNMARIAGGMRHLAPKADAILVTHGHFDHLLDVPIVMSRTHARLIASASAVELVRRLPDAGVSSKRCDAVTAGDERQLGPWKIRVLPATHDRLFGKVPFDQRETPGSGPPQHAADWVCGEPLAFLIEVGDQRIYIDSGGTLAQLPPHERVDLAILGMALPDSRARLPGSLERLNPRYVLPSHQDNFFRPLDAGFQFGPLTDFSRVRRDCEQANHGRLILLDYFRPWTLPPQEAPNPKAQIPSKKPNPKIQNER
jgi:L-ascorbate metabolism protein UlaG (beta-lactamase superfamily)